MKLPIKPLIAAALLVPLSHSLPATAQDGKVVRTGMSTADDDAYRPRFDRWYETVMPGKRLGIKLPKGHTLTINGERWTSKWRAPSSAQTLSATLEADGETVADINIFVLEPHSNIDSKGWLNGYRIGTYPRNPPKGFIRLDGPEDRKHALSPHFKLGQFLCKQQMDHWPKYVLVSQSNILRLEALLESLNEDGTIEAETFFVMSGFRTPFYNTAIGSAKFSRHMYGDAADIYVDVQPRNGTMDDLNGDGKVNKSDANFLYDYAQDLYTSRDNLPKGGIGAYRANAVHGPFVHVDGRGTTARWGR
ncbi:D-Ala-D-Ala carboxypeptidase family metallohydrolase [uncultured Algimonas sp.]|uniref:D-Ala-D-Ala carboxypeptidase family metallohydrolase n=1 Tax=uncultured Algimonas sp. TaxID=1547920 RepID=UPI00260ED25B|nr:D-Ala-D-Ala carboxypeptidase family metallohydrolase [uncultured Algimonas sp.]